MYKAAKLEDRFWAKVDKSNASDCWIWTAFKSKGYGQFGIGGKLYKSHRVAYELVKGPIPQGMTLDHLCKNKACVNPAHLEPVSQKENVLRGTSLLALNKQKTHCPKGHILEGENLVQFRLKKFGQRVCKTCVNERDRLYSQRSEIRARHKIRCHQNYLKRKYGI